MEIARSTGSDSSSNDDNSSHDSGSSNSDEEPEDEMNGKERRTVSSQRGDDDDSSSSESSDSSGSGRSDSSESESSDSSESDSDSDSNSEEEEEDDDVVQNDASLPLGERIRQQRERGLDLSEARARKNQARKIASERLAARDDKKKKDKGKEEAPTPVKSRKGKSKHAPTEVSSKRRDFYDRKFMGKEQVVGAGTGVDLGAHVYKPRDPRTSSLSGHLDEEHFERNYEFLNDMRNQEMELLKKRIAAHKTRGKKGQRLRQRLLKQTSSGAGRHFAGTTLEENVQELKRLQQEKATLERNQVDRNAKRAVKQKVKEKSGGGTYHLKRSEQKRLHLEARFEELRKRGGDQAVDKVLAKRRKKNKSKDAGLLGGSR